MDDEEYELLRETCSSHSVANPKDIEALRRFKQKRLERQERLTEEEATSGVESPKEIKARIAKALGRSVSSIDVFVSDWRKQYGKDLPWVSRVPGLSWMPVWSEFQKWVTTYAGQAAKRRRGRPPKN